MPAHAQAEVKAAYWQVFDDIGQPPGEQAVAEAQRQAFADRYQRAYPAAVACLTKTLTKTLPERTCYLRFPPAHWSRIRHSNLIERTFGETRRRTKVIGRLPGERSCLSLVWAVLDRAGRGWRGVIQTPAAVRLLQDLRRQLLHPTGDPGGGRRDCHPRRLGSVTRSPRPRFSTISGTPPTGNPRPLAAVTPRLALGHHNRETARAPLGNIRGVLASVVLAAQVGWAVQGDTSTGALPDPGAVMANTPVPIKG